tara:strand:+ start:763 stop:1188 length:426 start_codon:yes stop_codon:yes gene_type:complete
MAIWFTDYSKLDLNQGYVGLDKHLEIEFLELGENYLRAKMPVNENTKQPMGLLHGGASCVLAESVASFAAFLCIDPKLKTVVGLNLYASHLKSAKSGYVFATARPKHIGKSTSVWEIEIRNEEEELITLVEFTAMHKDIKK